VKNRLYEKAALCNGKPALSWRFIKPVLKAIAIKTGFMKTGFMQCRAVGALQPNTTRLKCFLVCQTGGF